MDFVHHLQTKPPCRSCRLRNGSTSGASKTAVSLSYDSSTSTISPQSTGCVTHTGLVWPSTCGPPCQACTENRNQGVGSRSARQRRASTGIRYRLFLPGLGFFHNLTKTSDIILDHPAEFVGCVGGYVKSEIGEPVRTMSGLCRIVSTRA